VRRWNHHPSVSATGTIQRVRASFTVVAVTSCLRAVGQRGTGDGTRVMNGQRAPQPEGVGVETEKRAERWNTTSATALSKNTVASAAVVSSGSASIAGAAAAMALPPQMLVPAHTSAASFGATPTLRASQRPSANVASSPISV